MSEQVNPGMWVRQRSTIGPTWWFVAMQQGRADLLSVRADGLVLRGVDVEYLVPAERPDWADDYPGLFAEHKWEWSVEPSGTGHAYFYRGDKESAARSYTKRLNDHELVRRRVGPWEVVETEEPLGPGDWFTNSANGGRPMYWERTLSDDRTTIWWRGDRWFGVTSDADSDRWTRCDAPGNAQELYDLLGIEAP